MADPLRQLEDAIAYVLTPEGTVHPNYLLAILDGLLHAFHGFGQFGRLRDRLSILQSRSYGSVFSWYNEPLLLGIFLLVYDIWIAKRVSLSVSTIPGAGVGLFTPDIIGGTSRTLASHTIVSTALALPSEIASTQAFVREPESSLSAGDICSGNMERIPPAHNVPWGVIGSAYFANASDPNTRRVSGNCMLIYLRRVWYSHEDYLNFVLASQRDRTTRRLRRDCPQSRESRFINLFVLSLRKSVHPGSELFWPYEFPPDEIDLSVLRVRHRTSSSSVTIDLTQSPPGSTTATPNVIYDRRANEFI